MVIVVSGGLPDTLRISLPLPRQVRCKYVIRGSFRSSSGPVIGVPLVTSPGSGFQYMYYPLCLHMVSFLSTNVVLPHWVLSIQTANIGKVVWGLLNIWQC